MRKHLLLLLAIGFLMAAAKSNDEAVAQEQKKLRGTWALVSEEKDGQKVAEADLQDVRLIFKDDGFTLKKGEDVRAQGTFTLDPAKKPKAMDATLKEGKDAGKTVLAIYELKGDTFKVCRAPTGKDRPDNFASESGSGVTLSVWKRVK
jgi:uncharacterized protein (TIGR03067 family)